MSDSQYPSKNLQSDDIMNYPWAYVVEPGHWDLTGAQVKKLREYLLKGGFLMTDDFHGTIEWDIFMLSMQRVFPDRPVVDLPNTEPIFHVLYDLDDTLIRGPHLWAWRIAMWYLGLDLPEGWEKKQAGVRNEVAAEILFPDETSEKKSQLVESKSDLAGMRA